MKLFIAVFLCKLTHFLGKIIGKGSSLPGKVALTLFPDILKYLKLPGIIIAVTGSNGKSSTSEMITHILDSSGMNTGYNREGSNQTEGVATLLLRKSTFRGSVKCDALVLECDERYASKIFMQVKPGVLVVTNLCRDQLTRNGHHEFIYDCLSDAVSAAGKNAVLILNADDPYVALLSTERSVESLELKDESGNLSDGNIIWFGAGKNTISVSSLTGVYDDGAFCPRCKERMEYDYRVAAHFGGYRCKACGHSRPEPDFEITKIDYDSGGLTLSDIAAGIYKAWLTAPGINGAYNVAAAAAAAAAAGIETSKAARCLDGYELKGGRTMLLAAGKSRVTLQICKHENSLAYNRALEWITRRGKDCSVVIIVDSISRKYYTSETSWLWDIDFDLLADGCVKEIVLTGRYGGELMMRFLMSGVDPGKYRMLDDISALQDCIKGFTTDDVYVLTCFADKDKLLKILREKYD